MTKSEIFQRVTDVQIKGRDGKRKVTNAMIVPRDNMLIPLESDIKAAVEKSNGIVEIEGCYAISLAGYDNINKYVRKAFESANVEEVWAVLFC